MDMVIFSIQEALNIQENVTALVENVIEDIGFCHGIPVVGLTIYKCLLNQKHLEAETTIVFDRLIQIIVSTIWVRDNNNQMAYWLSNASTLLFLIQKSLKLDDATSVQKPPPPTSLLARMAMGFGSFLSSVGLAEAEAALMVVQEVEAKNPALRFKQQLTDNVEKVYGIICDNLKKELTPLLALCIQAPTTSVRENAQSDHWQGIVDCLNTLLNTLKENFVPTVIVRRIFAHVFSYINVQLFNSLLLGRDFCTSNNGRYVNDGLAKLEHWCCEAKEEYAGSAWDELKHIRHAISFLTIHQKYRISKDEITSDLFPFLSIEQLYRLHTLFADGNDNMRSISTDVISSIRITVLMAECSNDSHNGSSNSFLLEDNSSIPFSADDLSTSLQLKDFTNVKPAVELGNYGALDFLYN
ncbi:hypothetical protein L2E82_29917 [Cichorium intybus]|uniref:Uncharacterized protein n=1 Tax=Cichorium intybus TaxID=13427 RepID=A0ACB9CZ39_CICIN|nr:hypothetical protein L2E82_29917 [Cichorium intybus]